MSKEKSKEDLLWYCNDMLTYIFGSEEDVEPWWDSPNLAFEGETPRKIFDIEPNRVYNYLLEFKEGGW